MNNMDILIYAAIAAFLLFRLWSVLGQRSEDEGKENPRPNPFERTPEKDADEENVVVLEGRARPAMTAALTGSGHAPTSLAGTLDQMKQIDPSFNEKTFMDGAKAAFRQIVECFAAGDLTKVVWLLGPNVRQPFEAAIAERQALGQKLLNKIDRIDAADIISAKVVDDVATLVVEFVSHQSHLLLAANESEQAKSWPRPEEARDVWTFRRDLKSADPNWLLVETHS